MLSPCCFTVPPLNTQCVNILACALVAVFMSAPGMAIASGDVFQPLGSPSVGMISQGTLDNDIGYVMVDSPFVLA